MKILIVCSFNSGRISPFIADQAEYLSNSGVITRFFLIKGKGTTGYIQNLPALKRLIKTYKPDIIHAHYGFSGLLANLQRKVPVITTFHGCDINIPWFRFLSCFAVILSKHSIFVSEKMAIKSLIKRKYSIIASGTNLNIFIPSDKKESRKKLNLSSDKKLVLFAGSFDDPVKNYALAKEAVKLLKDVELIELKGYGRNEVSLLLNSCDVALMTSFHEGSPMFIKEALACNRPVVSTNVGDVQSLLKDIEGCYITSYDPYEISRKIEKALYYSEIKGRERITELGYDLENINREILEVYHKVLS